ncbi:hypothetical protein P692DRAFT_20915538, partial [Suillus brevipes Sb2]
LSPASPKAVKFSQALVPSLRCSITLLGHLLTLCREAPKTYPQQAPPTFPSCQLTTSHLKSMDSRSLALSSLMSSVVPMIRPSFLRHRGIHPTRSSAKLCSVHHSISTAWSSPVSPLVFADMYSFPGQ